MKPSSVAIALLISLACAPRLSARNVDLSTVPPRNTVQLTIYNSEDLTLVRETRVVTFKQGVNPLQFSWAGTLIDPTSVELSFLTQPDQLDMVDTTFPHDKPQMLYWNVQSELDGEATIQITYFTSGITWSADYLCIANRAETEMGFEGFVRVYNNSGEQYEDAQVRLVVGTINLVEKVAQLARIPMAEVGNMAKDVRGRLELDAARKAMSRREVAADADMPAESAPKQIIKEGLSEYFIYSIEGTESIPNGWSKRLRSFEGEAVPFQIEYRYRPQEYGDQLVRMYLLTNDVESKLGTTPLPDGTVKVFRDNGRDGLSYLTQQTIKYIPVGDKIELNLGVDPEVVFELVKLRAFRDNIWMRIGGTNRHQKVGEGRVVVERNSAVAGWDDHSIYHQRVRNYSGKPIQLQIRRSYSGHIVFRSVLAPKLHDYQTVEFQTRVAAGERADLPFEIVQHQGYNSKQNNVTLENAEIGR